MEVSVVYYINDLRIRDHAPLAAAMAAKLPIIGVYVFDPFFFKETRYGFKKTEKFRAQFIIDSLADLKQNLKQYNIPLIIKVGPTEKVFSDLNQQFKIRNVFYQEQIGSEELKILKLIKLNLKETIFNSFEAKALLKTKDLPFSINNLPNVFTDFRKQVEANFKVDPLIKLPQYTQLDLKVESDRVDLKMLGFEEAKISLVIKAGESEALKRLNYYLFESKKASIYKLTRNGMANFDDSTKFSPYLANGNLSARQIYFALKEYEKTHGSNQSTYWILFELLWRDYFHFVHLKFGNKMFMAGGIANGKTKFEANESYRQAWINGVTGYQLVDANMLELNQTGWMSNRGRQNVASFLVKYLNQDYRFGAAYFEALLLDYDVSSNYGNWLYLASLGNDPRENRVFNVNKQGKDYDPKGVYLTKWLPQFKKLPVEFYYASINLNELQELTLDFKLGVDYPKPIVKSLFKD